MSPPYRLLVCVCGGGALAYVLILPEALWRVSSFYQRPSICVCEGGALVEDAYAEEAYAEEALWRSAMLGLW